MRSGVNIARFVFDWTRLVPVGSLAWSEVARHMRNMRHAVCGRGLAAWTRAFRYSQGARLSGIAFDRALAVRSRRASHVTAGHASCGARGTGRKHPTGLHADRVPLVCVSPFRDELTTLRIAERSACCICRCLRAGARLRRIEVRCEVWTRLPACEMLDRLLESGAVETVRQASRRRRQCRSILRRRSADSRTCTALRSALNAAVLQ